VRRLSWKAWLGGSAAIVLLAVAIVLVWQWPLWAAQSSFDGDQAYEYLVEICKLGRRPSGSEGMAKQQEMLKRHFEDLGGKVEFQKFEHRWHPGVKFANLIVQWHPRAKDRVLLGAHYDTRPYPDRDPRNPRGTFIGANDGASGVAVLMELAKSMPKLESKYGVDFVLFDAEEYIFRVEADQKEYCLGSEYFALQYSKDKSREHRYVWGVVMDMVGDADLQIFKEKNSLRTQKGSQLVRDIWAAAGRVGVREFYSRVEHEVTDDHVPLNNIAKIPTCDIIDFDYPYWHTEGDVPERCSAASLSKVGRVVLEWLKTAR